LLPDILNAAFYFYKMVTMEAKANIRFEFSSEKQLNAIVNALSPEINKPLAGRAKVALEREEGYLVLWVEAKDTVALRSALNAYLRWIGSIVNVIEVVEGP
jgi:tRNA threonylcarbamoyladenosine modification (KEOPS) complex  Pcc1 subunit